MTLHTFKRQLKAYMCSRSDVLANRRNIHHRPALLWRIRDSGAGYKTADLQTYLLTYLLILFLVLSVI